MERRYPRCWDESLLLNSYKGYSGTLKTVCLMLLKTQYAIFLTFIGALKVVHSPFMPSTVFSVFVGQYKLKIALHSR